MFTATAANEPTRQRVRASARVAAKLRGTATVLDRLYQQGSAKIHLPRTPAFEAVAVNTAGGLTGGDVLSLAAEAGAGTAMTLTTQAAERIYRSLDAPASVSNSVTVGAGAQFYWLPQETILFNNSALDRRLEIDMAEDAALLAIEPLVLGRKAMGESVTHTALRDAWRVRRGGRLIYADALRLSGDIRETLGGAAHFGGALACASLLYVAVDAEDRVDALREALCDDACGFRAGASAWNGLLTARILAQDGAALRVAMLRALGVLRTDPPPRVWNC